MLMGAMVNALSAVIGRAATTEVTRRLFPVDSEMRAAPTLLGTCVVARGGYLQPAVKQRFWLKNGIT
jgi:hypothetical protein